MRTASVLLLALGLSACSADIEVQTDPFDQSVPVTSVAVPAYAEVAIDIPSEAQGVPVTVDEISADLSVVNPLKATSLQVSARLSFTGTATPQTPYLFTELNKPPYFAQSLVLLPSQTFGPASTTPVHITNPALKDAIHYSRIWLIVSNTVTNTGFGDTLPFQVDLKGITLHALVTKDFSGLQGGEALGGL